VASEEWTEIVLEDCISEIIYFNFGMEPADSFMELVTSLVVLDRLA
jgi:hypothetical protein